MTTTTSPRFYLGFVPGYFTRHLHSSLDGVAVCGAPSVPQGDRTAAADLLRIAKTRCERCAVEASK